MIIQAAEARKLDIFISEDTATEISQVLAYPKIEKIYRAVQRRQDLIEQVLKTARFVQVTSKVGIVNEHPADNKILECALAADADYIISGDKHLLKLISYEEIQVLSVSDFLKLSANINLSGYK